MEGKEDHSEESQVMSFSKIILVGAAIVASIYAFDVVWTVFFETHADMSTLTFREKNLLVVSMETQAWIGT